MANRKRQASRGALSRFFEEAIMATAPSRTKDNAGRLIMPPGTSDSTMHNGEGDGKTILVCTLACAVLHYDARCIDDLHEC